MCGRRVVGCHHRPCRQSRSKARPQSADIDQQQSLSASRFPCHVLVALPPRGRRLKVRRDGEEMAPGGSQTVRKKSGEDRFSPTTSNGPATTFLQVKPHSPYVTDDDRRRPRTPVFVPLQRVTCGHPPCGAAAPARLRNPGQRAHEQAVAGHGRPTERGGSGLSVRLPVGRFIRVGPATPKAAVAGSHGRPRRGQRSVPVGSTAPDRRPRCW